MRGAVALVALLLALAPFPLRAQDGTCGTEGCRFGRHAAAATLDGLMLAGGGGNPWLGSASTLGFRTLTFPRIGVQARAGFTGMDVPGRGGEGAKGVTPMALAAGGSMAILDGISPAPTVGGLGSVDVFANAGVILLPGDAGFGTGSPFTWSIGARIGIFRESFTLPGITGSVAYRGIGGVDFDRPAVLEREAGFSWSSASAWQVRGVVGKRLSAFALAGGFGWDAAGAEVAIASRTAGTTAIDDPVKIETDRYHVFADLTWTSLVWSLTLEAGYQLPVDEDGILGDSDLSAGGRAFASLGARITF